MLVGATVAASAFLLFALQPMVGKMVLPSVGGAPAAWNSCLFFFQAALLGGALYAHGTTRWLEPRAQAFLHLALVLAAATLLPIRVEADLIDAASSASPTLAILDALFVRAALPVIALAATTPLVQSWLARRGGTEDPYTLYAASNTGSLVGLLAYPFWIEPRLGIGAQAGAWGAGFLALVALLAGSALVTVLRAPFGRDLVQGSPADETAPQAATPLRWMILAAVPSSLILSVSAYLSADVAAAPLFWVIPLSLYLVSWVIAFAPGSRGAPWWVGRGLALLTAPLLVAILSEASYPVTLLVALHLAAFFLAAWLCHGELNRSRPEPRRIAEFYVWIALGGALGGLFNALVAPLVFPAVSEYPLGLIAACALRPAPRGTWRAGAVSDVAYAAGIAALAAVLAVGAGALAIPPGRLRTLVVFLVPMLLAYRAVQRPRRLALAFVAILIAAQLDPGAHGRVVVRERNFFGVVRVTRPEPGRFHVLVHGRTVHGRQSLIDGERTRPLSYYHEGGPFGALIAARRDVGPTPRIAVIGLGAGAMAAYARPAEEWTFYEIDPTIVRVATDPRLFTYLRDAAGTHRFVLGDARIRLAEAPDRSFDLLVLDAFSSDVIPVHLLTREAFALYRAKVRRGGWLALHVSSRLVDLEPVVASLARDARWVARMRDDFETAPDDEGRDPSRWVVMASSERGLGRLADDDGWRRPRRRQDVTPWTDEFSSLWKALQWEGS